MSGATAITVNILLKKDAAGFYAAHCLDLDIVAAAPTVREAQLAIGRLIVTRVRYAFVNGNLGSLFYPAPIEVWREFDECSERTRVRYAVVSPGSERAIPGRFIPPWVIANTGTPSEPCRVQRIVQPAGMHEQAQRSEGGSHAGRQTRGSGNNPVQARSCVPRVRETGPMHLRARIERARKSENVQGFLGLVTLAAMLIGFIWLQATHPKWIINFLAFIALALVAGPIVLLVFAVLVEWMTEGMEALFGGTGKPCKGKYPEAIDRDRLR